MEKKIKLVSLNIVLNIFLFILMIFTIQNSSQKVKIFVLSKETINLPVSFVLGTSFILGSINGSLLTFIIKNKRN